MKYFTAVPLGLYNSESNDVPENAIPIADELYQELIEGQGKGRFIQADNNGKPILVDGVSVTDEQQLNQIANQKQFLLNKANAEIAWRQDAFDMDIATEEEVSALKLWKEYRITLMRMEISTVTDISWPNQP
ncbi:MULTISPECIES: tail fiber assembly protein [Citrobacter]|jgi:hypothetical protein|uniref:tail fiber assembly protein n=1 Tax=Citrobacter TaxID=544 RepID=UPI0002D344EF|nr:MULTISPECIES: tail assembly chaperone [Citrobacter]EGI6871011.1 tail assembly chaperone [Escherichia coli]DAP79732.1 MAG TPA: tail fiber assembly protein [Caudoviricetes sp.]ARC40760.1 tail assembly chaperone [Citrobacter braakii]MDM3279998.1 tail assembly chaperone [Citrobacter sp. Ce104]MDM3350215.1 tail assembly chaperone [Citrobacter sp. Cb007]